MVANDVVLTSGLETLSEKRNFATFYRLYNGEYSRHRRGVHLHILNVPQSFTTLFTRKLLFRIIKLWNELPDVVFPTAGYDMRFFKKGVKNILEGRHRTGDPLGVAGIPERRFADLLDFSLETVPPMIEKVESRDALETDAQSQDADIEIAVNAVGIEEFLEMAMVQPDDDMNSGKVKKKKHKKSKKSSAITLDEFLSMNQDVFGEGLDFQGVEEVPTRVVKKQLKNKKSSNAAASAELEKLKQKGIVVMKVAGSKPIKNVQKRKATPKRELKTSSEVLTKLINQSNNQIKIVKKSNAPKSDAGQIIQNTNLDKYNTSTQNLGDNKTPTKDDCEQNMKQKNLNETESNCAKSDDSQIADNYKSSSSKTEDLMRTPKGHIAPEDIDKNMNTSHHENDTDDDEYKAKQSIFTSNNKDNSEQTSKVTVPDYLPKLMKNEEETKCQNIINNKVTSNVQEASDFKIVDKSNVRNTENVECSDKHIDDIEKCSNKNSAQSSISPVVDSLSTLKYLSHLTVKPINQIKNIPAEGSIDKITETKNAQKIPVKNDKEPSRPIDNEITSPARPKVVADKDPTLDALKNLSRNITIKSLSTSTKRNITESENDDDNEELQNPNNRMLTDVSGNKNVTIKKIKIEKDESVLGSKVISTQNNTIKNTAKLVHKINTSTPEIKSNKTSVDNIQNSPVKQHTNILKHLTDITTKPLTPKKIIPMHDVKQTSVEKTHKEAEIIEISDIDDSDDETGNKQKIKVIQDATKPVDPLKNLSKHITVKSLNQPVQSIQKNIKIEKTDDYNDDENQSHTFTSDDDIPFNTKLCSQKLSSRHMAFKNALKNLGKNITVKSRNSSPCQLAKSQDHNSQDSDVDEPNEDEYDSGSDIGKVKITEMDNGNSNHDENFDNINQDHFSKSPIIESPHGSENDNEELGEMDYESEIRATTVQKTNHEITTNKNNICLNNLKNMSKSITIKSVNSNTIDKQEKPPQPQETLEVMKNQAKQIALKSPQQTIKESPNENTSNSRNLKKMVKVADHTSSESLNQKVSVNKEVTVKTFQTKTVIQEITTTVTKTIKTVNQTMNKQETRNSSQMNIPVLPHKVQGMRPSTSKNLQGVVIRHAAPVAVKNTNNSVAQIRPPGTVVRPSKQIVPMRPGLNITRPSNPRMPSAKTNLPKSSPNKPVMGRPLKFSPSVITSTVAKRPHTEEASGPFSCFKKPKESLIPVSDIPTFGGESIVQVNAASHTSTSNYTSTSKIVRANSVVTATHMKSEVTSMQQFNRLNNTVGIKVKSAQVKQTQVQEKSECSPMKRNTLEAIEKLQKQGLLVKKPRIELNETSDTDRVDDNVDNSSADEHNE